MEPTLGEAFHKLVIFSFPSNLDLEATVKCCKCVIFSRTWSISGSVVEKKCGGTTQIIPPTQLMHQTHNHACFVFLFFFVFARLDVVPFCLWRKYGFVKSMAVSREEGPQITLCMEHQQTPIYAHKQKHKQKVYLSQRRGFLNQPGLRYDLFHSKHSDEELIEHLHIGKSKFFLAICVLQTNAS